MTREEKEIIEKVKEIEKKEASKAKVKKIKKRKGLFMKLIIVFMFVYLTIFTYKVLDIFEKTGAEPTTLVGAVFVFCGWESGCLSKIKISKQKTKGDDVEC